MALCYAAAPRGAVLMIIEALSLCLFAANPQPVKLGATSINVIDIPASRADFYTDFLAERLTREGFKVVTPREISTALGLERQKQLLGCPEDATSCLAEVANALGVDGIVIGDAARVSGRYQVTLKIVASSNAQRIGGYTGSATTEAELLDELSRGAHELAVQVGAALGRVPHQEVISTSSSTGGVRRLSWIPALVGGVAFVGGGVGLLSAHDARQRLEQETLTRGQADEVLATGNTGRTLGYVGLGIGAAALVAAGTMYLLGEPAPVTPQVAIVPAGAAVGFSGSLP